MNTDNSDRILTTKTSPEYKPSIYNPTFERKIEAARRGIKKYRNTLIDLAK